jgi:hypothetical protein
MESPELGSDDGDIAATMLRRTNEEFTKDVQQPRSLEELRGSRRYCIRNTYSRDRPGCDRSVAVS